MSSDRQFSLQRTSRIVASQAAETSLAQQQRDVYDSHRHRTFSIAFYMTGNELEAENILSETFVSAFRSTSVPDASVIDDSLLKALEARFEMAPSPGAVEDCGASLAGRNVRRTDLEESLLLLPPRERLVFLLNDVEGYPTQKTASLLGCGTLDVQRLLIAARIRLRNAIATRATGPATEERAA